VMSENERKIFIADVVTVRYVNVGIHSCTRRT